MTTEELIIMNFQEKNQINWDDLIQINVLTWVIIEINES